jgi:PAS domain S-box-containing protein
MCREFGVSLTLRLILLALLAAAPGVVLQVWNYADLRRSRTVAVEGETWQLARTAGGEIDRISEGARQFLVALAHIPQIRNVEEADCTELLSRIRADYRSYRALIVANRVGDVVCSSIGPGPPIADRLYFRRAVDRNNFAVGEYVHGRGTQAPVFHFSYPLRDGSGEVTGVVAAALDLDWLAQQLATRVRSGMTLFVTDPNGTILVRLPDNVNGRGQSLSESFARALAASNDAVVTAHAGVEHYIIGRVTAGATGSDLGVILAWEQNAAFADLQRVNERAAVLIILGLLLSLTLAVFWGAQAIRHPIHLLLRLVERWQGGEYATSGTSWDRSELGRLGNAFDTLALTVKEREQDLRASREQLRARERYLSAVLDRIPTGIMQVDAAGRYVFVNRHFCRIVQRSEREMIGRPFTDFTHPGDVGRNLALFTHSIETRQPYNLRKRYLRPDGSFVWIDITVAPLSEESSDLLTVAVDLTERVQAEEHQKLLMNELNHRVKNTLATVQALAMLTKRHTDSPAEFYRAFSERLVALSATHNLLAEGTWEGALLDDLIRSELSPYIAKEQDRVIMDGPKIWLNPNEAISLGLLIHELTTNAAKYGALRGSTGLLQVHWRNEKDRWVLTWNESSTTAPTSTKRRGFGSYLIEQTVQMLRGEVESTFTPAGLTCTIAIPRTASGSESRYRPQKAG